MNQLMSTLTGIMSALAAVFSAVAAFLSFKLARSIQDELKSDETLISGVIGHPALKERSHADAIVQIPVFNKSKRKAYIDALAVYDRNGQPIEVTWSDKIDDCGNPSDPSKLIGIIDFTTVYVRRNDGEKFTYARILFKHSFSETRCVAVFDEYADFAKA